MWKAKLKDGKKVDEINSKWSEIKDNIETLSYDYNGTEVKLPTLNGKIKEYVQWKSASADLSGGAVTIESQTVGVVLEDGTNILLRFSMKEKKVDVSIG